MIKAKRLLLVDSHAVIHRAYHALPKENFKQGNQLINAVYGFFSMIISGILEINPDYVITCFDAPGPNFRHEKFIAYQANRKKTDDDLKDQINIVRKNVKKIGFPVLIKKGFEADDILGTIAKKAKKRKLEVVIITGDKDLMQLVDNKVNLFLMKRGISGSQIVDSQGVEKHLGIKPSQVVDFKALVGDPSDNYSGVYGIGPKTAVNLLTEYCDLNGVYKNLDNIAPSIVEKLKKDKDSANLSKDLATIDCSVPVKMKLKKSKWDDDKIKELKTVMQDLHFRSLVKRIDKKFAENDSKRQMSLI